MESSTVTPLLKRLEKMGHVERRRDSVDERQVNVFLTPMGDDLSTKAPEITRCMVEETGLSIDDLEDLVAKLGALSANLSTENGQD
jgi:DNA-binding MarR family transcriptional regulator